MKPLSNIKVLDFSRIIAGPFCTMLLGDLGADVVKVESQEGDSLRHQGPPFYHGHSSGFLAFNRNKRSVVLDLRDPRDKATALGLADRADILVENFRPGVMDRLGLGYDALQARNPRLIYTSISGMGASGPDRDMGAFDLTIQAEAGYMSITGERNGAPIKLGTSAFDLICGQYALSAILACLYQRQTTGAGQRIETSLFEGQISFLADAGMDYLTTGARREKWGSEHSSLVPYKAFRTADGWIVIGAGHQKLFEKLLAILDRSDLANDPRFLSVQDRNRNRDALYADLDAAIATCVTSELLARLRQAGVPASPVNDVGQVFAHPQALHRGMLQHLQHQRYGRVPTIGPAVKYGGFDILEDWQAPPDLGEHQSQVVADWIGPSAHAAAS